MLARDAGSACSATTPAMLEAGAQYLRIVGPAYGFFGMGLALYFASQGAGRLLWPLLGRADPSRDRDRRRLDRPAS